MRDLGCLFETHPLLVYETPSNKLPFSSLIVEISLIFVFVKNYLLSRSKEATLYAIVADKV